MPSRRLIIVLGAAAAATAAGGLYLQRRQPVQRSLFRIGLIGRGDINTLEPSQAATESPISIVWNIYDRLVQRSPQGVLQGRLAESWRSNPERTEWRFKIRSGVRFGDTGFGKGTTLSPEDVRFSINRAVRLPGYARTLLVDVVEGVASVLNGSTSSISGLVIDGDELVFRLIRPFSFLPDRLAASYLSIVPTGTPDAGEQPAGTGAFALQSWDRTGRTIRLSRHATHWGPVSPRMPTEIAIRSVPSEALGAAELKSGGLDLAEFNASALPAMRDQADGAYRIEEYDHTELRLIALNTEKPPFNGPHSAALGRALNLGIDRAALVQILGGGNPFAGPVPLPNQEAHQLQFDAEAARTLVQSVPTALRSIELLVEPVDEARLIAELLVRQWRTVGLDVRPVYGRADFFPVVISGNYQMALAYYGPYIPSPEQYLWMYRADSAPVPNVMRFKDPAFEVAFADYTRVTGDADQQAALARALDRLLALSPTVWILKPPRYMASRHEARLLRSAGLPLYATLFG